MSVYTVKLKVCWHQPATTAKQVLNAKHSLWKKREMDGNKEWEEDIEDNEDQTDSSDL